ncbi:hypothetical protein PHMEG_00041397, partial [Phytophthora megakarya]
MKFTAGIVLIAVAVAEAAAESTNTLTTNPNTPTVNPKMVEGLGPQTPAGDDPKIKHAMDLLTGSHVSSSGSNYYTIDPKSLPTNNPQWPDWKSEWGLGPAIIPQEGASTDGTHRQLESTNTLTTDPNTPTVNPKMVEGLGPQTPAGDDPKIKHAMDLLTGSHVSSSGSNYYTIDPKSLPTNNPQWPDWKSEWGLGPAIIPQ